MYDKKLNLFLLVADMGSFSKAANAVFMTPASVMNQMNSLEAELGIRIFVRSKRGVALTSAGRYLYDQTKELVKLSNNIVSSLRGIDEKERAVSSKRFSIRIGSSLLCPHQPLMRILTRDRSFFSHFDTSIVSFDDSDIETVLTNLGSKIDIIAGDCDSSAWLALTTAYPIGKRPFTIAIPHGHRLSLKKILTIDDLYGESLLTMAPGASSGCDRLRFELKRNHKSIHLTDGPKSFDMDTFNRCERENLMLLSFNTWKEVHPAFVNVPVTWPYESTFGLLSPKQMTVNVLHFFEALQEAQENRSREA